MNKVEGNIRAGMFDVGAMVGIHCIHYTYKTTGCE